MLIFGVIGSQGIWDEKFRLSTRGWLSRELEQLSVTIEKVSCSCLTLLQGMFVCFLK